MYISIVDGYAMIMDRTSRKCSQDAENMIFWDGSYDLESCQNLCDTDVECNFMYIGIRGWCGLFKSCDTRIRNSATGSTYEKLTNEYYDYDKLD